MGRAALALVLMINCADAAAAASVLSKSFKGSCWQRKSFLYITAKQLYVATMKPNKKAVQVQNQLVQNQFIKTAFGPITDIKVTL